MRFQHVVYEIHRPVHRQMPQAMDELSPYQAKLYVQAKDRAVTGGPLMVDGRVATVMQGDLDRIMRGVFRSHIQPCWKDEATGHVYAGAFIYVPRRG
jgi:hypothetical protein